MNPRTTTPSRSARLRQSLAGIATQQLSEVKSAIRGLSRLQATLLLLGACTVAYGGVQMLQLLIERTAPVLGVGGWWLGGPLIVDLIAVPIVVIVGVVIGRVVPVGWRRYVTAASALSFLFTLVAFPFLTGLGRRQDNDSLLDRNYWAGYLAVLALVWGLPLVVRLARTIPRPPRTRGRRTAVPGAGGETLPSREGRLGE